MICKFIFFRNQSSLITMREKELTIRPTDYIPQNAIKSNVIKKRSEEPRVHKVHAIGILRYALDDNTSDILYMKMGSVIPN